LIGLAFATLIIWSLLYNAQFLEYDENYGNILSAFFMSLLFSMLLAVLWFKRRDILISHKWQTILFLIISSPITITFVIIKYQVIFDTVLKN
jgi:hypothetical protein